MLGLGSNLTKGGAGAKTIVTDSLVLKHNYTGGAVQPLSDGAADINADAADDEYIDVGTIPITTNDVTMCAWVYVTSWVNYAGVVSNRGVGSGDPGVQIRHDNLAQRFELIIDDGVDSARTTSGDLKNSNQWYHVCGVWDRDDKQYLYVDGILEASYAITDEAGSLTHSTNVFIGSNSTASEMGGYVCNVGYWDRVLSQAEVKSIMNKNYAGLSDSEKTDLVSWWNLDSVIPDTTTFVYDNHYGGGEVLGSELVVGDWLEQNGWTNITGGIRQDGTDGHTSMSSEMTDFNGSVFKISYTLSNVTDPTNLKWKFGGGTLTTIGGTEGDHVYYLTSDATADNFQLSTNGNWAGDVTNISVKLVNGNTGTLS